MLEKLLREELAAIGILQQLLQQEYDALRTRDVSVLESVAGEKQIIVNQLHDLDTVRVTYLCEQGFAADRQGLHACLNTVPTREQRGILSKLVSEFEHAIEQVHVQNEVNGAVITASRGYVEQALAIISGRDPLEFLYDHDSRKVFSHNNGQPIAKA
ncbi:MAG TPA: flagellar protein FlgN [Candidatus Competibacteraceae bacterium]|nr:flagellar protein FlgN [Candidatus Competibacteraceae bacterium]MCP5132474.1 flagellar protein FlgN [Gammaproteobacteria bacterium]HPF60303.1 flagellar protein FlgN [Candidatus Competibacteraceae bacterium]HRY18517.1 flagellar protein FlgN [Candidatus Competibacteraceae bacterium]